MGWAVASMVCAHVSAQTAPAYPDALALREKFPKDEIAALRSVTTYEFVVDPSDGLIIHEKEFATYIALQTNARLTQSNYTNSYLQLDRYSLKDPSGKKVPHSTYCGQEIDESIFYTDGSRCLYAATIRHTGETVNYEIENTYSDAKYLANAILYDRYPCRERVVRFIVPEGVDIELIEYNFAGYNVRRKQERVEGKMIYTFELSLTSAYHGEDHLPAPLQYLPHLLIISKGYTDKRGAYHPLLARTADLYAWYSSLTGKLVNDYTVLRPFVQGLVKDAKSDYEKMALIYYWVQDNIRYIAFEDGVAAFKPAEAAVVFYNRYGDCKGMANLTKAMMTLAGLDARLSWIGTDRIPYTYATPSIAVDNHMICTVMLDGKPYFLDATEKFNLIGSYAERIQGKETMVEDGKGFIIEKIPVSSQEVPDEQSVVQARMQEHGLEGTGHLSISGDMKRNTLQALRLMKPDHQQLWLKSVALGQVKAETVTLTRKPSLHRDSAAAIGFTFRAANSVFRNNKEVYVNLDLDRVLAKEVIPKDRKAPYQLEDRMFKTSLTTLDLPDGMSVQQLPPPLSVRNENLELDLGYEVKDNVLRYRKSIRVINRKVQVSSFDAWNRAIRQLKDYYEQPVILVGR